MRSHSLVAACVILALCNSVALAAKPHRVSKSPVAVDDPSPAAKLVEAALAAEASGQTDSRDALLQQAVDADPSYAAAHWHRGEVLVDGQWLKVEAAQQRAIEQGKIYEYNSRRVAAGSSAADQLDLAGWCRQQGLIEQQTAHALLALGAGSNAADARSELSQFPAGGMWLTAAEIAQRQRQAERAQLGLETWTPQIKQWLRSVHKSDRTKNLIRQLDDPTAIPAIESMLSVKNQETALLAVAALANMPEQAATASLVRHAVLSEWEDVRTAAAEALQPRSLYGYAPLLLAGLELPIQMDMAVIQQGVGSWNYRCQLFREGPMADASLDATFRVQRQQVPIANDGNDGRIAAQNRSNYRQGLAAVASAGAANARRIQQLNDRSEQVNARISQALTLATAGTDASPVNRPRRKAQAGQPMPTEDPANPRYWWEWWYDYNDIYYTSERPVTEYTQFDQQTQPPPQAHECFVAGTPVWTPTGKMAIELAQPGDLVLAQHPETGEFAYKAVLATTERPPVTLLRVETGADAVVVTRGHPLWVSGKGWRMARELELGDRLHTASGPREITAIETAPKAAAYNLVVVGFNTYFAGEAKLLAHDNNLRQPTDVVVPGLLTVR